jgi:cytochrome c biogenesis protein ResB
MMRVGDSDTGPSPLRMLFHSQSLAKRAAALSGPIKNFRSTVSFIEGDKVVQTRTVQVNQPLSYKGYTFYQLSYNPEDLSWSTLEVVRDPGVVVVYSGFALLMVGLLIIFYLNPWLSQLSAEHRKSNS